MALKAYVEADGILIMKEKSHDTTITTGEDGGGQYKVATYWELAEDETEWYGLTKTAAENQVDLQPQPGTGSDWDNAEWAMSLDNKEVGSYTLTRRRHASEMTGYDKWYI